MSEEKEYPPAPEGKVLRHAVFFSFRDTTTEKEVQEVVDAFRALPSKIDAIIDFAWGINNSPESLDDGFTHCFLLTFKDEAGRAEYLPQLRLVALPFSRRCQHLRVEVRVQFVRLFCRAVELGGAVGEQTRLLFLHGA